LFVRDLPRLSVDIDLTYLPIEDRATSLARLDAALRRIATRIRQVIAGSRTQLVPLRDEPLQRSSHAPRTVHAPCFVARSAKWPTE
jgi:hypothetical protein